MPQHLTCPHGHQWQTEDAEGTIDACPVCGSVAGAPTRDEAARGEGSPTLPARLDAAAPQAAAGYEVLGELGRGGMAVVYKARARALNRIVALKFLAPGSHAHPGLLERFRREGESLARLQHPNIVQIYEVGECDGQLYLALEYAEGGSLSRKLAATPQPPRKAAELVLTVARAVHFAHQRGVLHRDLKPANVLLTADGTPKVADFGLAKQVEGEPGTPPPDALTQTGAVLGTPGYMAPEQASAVTRRLTPAVDVYALGAVLYEMLTGRPPFLAEGPMETMLLVLTEDPIPPRRLQAKVPRDLETICLHCLRKNPRQRYASAAALADDLQCFLDGRPIRARPAGPGERLVKWAKRRPALASLVAVSTLAVVAGLSGVGWYQYQLYRKNEDLTASLHKEELQRRRNHDLLVAALDAMSNYGAFVDEQTAALPQSEEARRRLLEYRLGFYAPLLRQEPNDPETRRYKGRALFETAAIHQYLGRSEEAEKEYREALDLYALALKEAPSASLRRDQARATIQLGNVLHARGRTEEAEQCYRDGAALLEDLEADDPTNADYRQERATAYNNLALLLSETARLPPGRREAAGAAVGVALAAAEDARLAAARQTHEKVIGIREKLIEDFMEEDRYKWELAGSHNNLGTLYQGHGRPDDARREYESARDALLELPPRARDEANWSYLLGGVHFNLGLLTQGRDDGRALREFREARRLWDALQRSYPRVPDYRLRTAVVERMLAVRYGNADAPADGEKALAHAVELYDGLPPDVLAAPAAQADLARCLYYLGDARVKQGRPGEAEEAWRREAGVLEKLVEQAPENPSHPYELGYVYNLLGDLSRTRAAVLEALPSVGLTVTPYPLGMGLAGKAGQLQSARDQREEAAKRWEQAVRRLRQAVQLDPTNEDAAVVQLPAACLSLGNAAFLLGDHERLAVAAEGGADAAAWEAAHRAGGGLAPLYYRRAAAGMALCIVGARLDAKLTDAQRDARVRDYADRALQLLHKAVAAGYRDAAELRKAPDLQDPALRPGIEALLRDLEKQGKP